MYADIHTATGIGTSVEGRLAGKTAIVVGGGQTAGETIGNGRAAAILFARAGAHVMVADRDLDRARDTAIAIEAEGGQALAHQCDVALEQDCAAMVERAMSELGTIDVLHNNVGIGSHDGSPTRFDEEGLDLMLAVNLKGMMFTCKYAVPHMQQAGRGSVINISSVAAITPYPGVGYKTTKAAVNAYTQTLAIRVAGDGVRANVIMPGLMDTPMAIEGNVDRRGISREDVRAQRDRMVPLGRKMGSGWDIAHAALFLASDESRFVTGIELAVDGGSSARRG
jgi:NAD(P)-dependent dehydrogenase (short-subunit alcohol dehydrogenase family)